MSAVIAFPMERTGAPERPAPEIPAVLAVLPSRIARGRWLRREALRIAAMVGGASYVAVHRAILTDHARAGIPDDIALSDAADAVSAVRDLVSALEHFAREPRWPGPNDRGAA